MGEKPAWMEHWKELMQLILTLLITLGFFATLWKILGMEGDTVTKDHMVLLTCLSTNFGIIVGYFFGSSKGSSDKTGMLKKTVVVLMLTFGLGWVTSVKAEQLESGRWWMPTQEEISVDWKEIGHQQANYKLARDEARTVWAMGDYELARSWWAKSRDLALYPMPRAYRSNDIGYSFIQEKPWLEMTVADLNNAKEHLEAAVADFNLEGPARHEEQRVAGLAKASTTLQSVKDRLAALAARKADG